MATMTPTWFGARTFPDLCELMARWLEGTIPTRPGYQPGCGPDTETAALVPVLAACCRAGFLTDNAQPGSIDCRWRRRPAVTGFVHDRAFLRRLSAQAQRAGLTVVSAGTAASTDPVPGRVVIAEADGKPAAGYTSRLTRRDLMYRWQDVSMPGIGLLCAAEQVTLFDPVYGPGDRLWRLLDQISGRTR